MRFPVFLLGLVFTSVAVGLSFWVFGASVGKSTAWALLAFFVGQLLYVAMICILARAERKSSRPPVPERKPADPAVPVLRARLAARHDQQG